MGVLNYSELKNTSRIGNTFLDRVMLAETAQIRHGCVCVIQGAYQDTCLGAIQVSDMDHVFHNGTGIMVSTVVGPPLQYAVASLVSKLDPPP